MRGTSWLVTLRRGGESEGRKMKKKEKKKWGKKIPTAFFLLLFLALVFFLFPVFCRQLGRRRWTVRMIVVTST